MSTATQLSDYVEAKHGLKLSSTQIVYAIITTQLQHFIHSLDHLSLNSILLKLKQPRQALILAHLSKKTKDFKFIWSLLNNSIDTTSVEEYKPLFDTKQLLALGDDVASPVLQALDILAIDMLNHLIHLSADYQKRFPHNATNANDTYRIPVSSPFMLKQDDTADDSSNTNTLFSHSIQAAYLEHQRIASKTSLNKNTIHLL